MNTISENSTPYSCKIVETNLRINKRNKCKSINKHEVISSSADFSANEFTDFAKLVYSHFLLQ